MCSGCSDGRGGDFKLVVTDQFYTKAPKSRGLLPVVRTGVFERVRYLTVSSVSCDWTADDHHHSDVVCVCVSVKLIHHFSGVLGLCWCSIKYQIALSTPDLMSVLSDHYSYIKTYCKACNETCSCSFCFICPLNGTVSVYFLK